MNKQIKSNSKHIMNLAILTVFILLVVMLVTRFKYIYGSSTDWVNQHSVLPDYFRHQFYKTGNLIPEFTMNLGGGQNIFNFSYHGFLSPITLISYALPMVPMRYYVIISNILLIIASVYLIYFWLRGNGFKERIAFVAALLFTCASPLLYHSHKQVMFVDYMPFMIMALMGIDRLFAKRKKGLLIISVFLMFMTSYFFSVSGLVALTFYAVYKYLGRNEKLTVKNFMHDALPYGLSVITGILMSAVLLVPSFIALMAGRSANTQTPLALKNIVLPTFSASSLLYSAYGIGLTSVGILAVVAFVIYSKKKECIFLGLSILAFSIFPFLIYLLNGFLYIREKALIPFLPLVILIVAYFLTNYRNEKYPIKRLLISYPIIIVLMIINSKHTAFYVIGVAADLGMTLLFIYLSRLRNNPKIFYVPTMIIAIIACISANLSDPLLEKDYVNTLYSKDKYGVIDETISKDLGVYRSNDMCDNKSTNNIIYDDQFLQTGLYSSAFNKGYIRFCNYDLNLSNPTVNDISITNSNDILFQTFMGVKYIVTKNIAPIGYSLVKQQGPYKVYRNDNAYALGFATSELMSLNEYKRLSPADKRIALLKYIVVNKDLPDIYRSPLTPVALPPVLDFAKKKGDYHHVKLKTPKLVKVPLPTNLNKDIYIANAHIKRHEKIRVTIKINEIQNSLSQKKAAYPNSNFDFQYIISDSADNQNMNFYFDPGDYFITDFRYSKVDYDTIKKLGDNLDMLKDINIEADNIITGKINVTKAGFFTATIPYDDGFTVYVDGKMQPFQKVNSAFLGFEVAPGKHDIKLVYHTPYLKVGKLLSIIGILLFACILLSQFYMQKRVSCGSRTIAQ